MAGTIPDIILLPEQSGGENFAPQSSRGSIFLRKSTENGLCPFSGPHTEKRDNAESRGAVLPLRGESKEDTSSLANLWFLSFREERNLGRGLSKPAIDFAGSFRTTKKYGYAESRDAVLPRERKVIAVQGA